MENTGFWANAVSTVIGAAVGALLAFELERRRRNFEQRRREVGRCHQLACLLVNRLNVLQDFHEQLFLNFEAKHHRPPEWHEVGAVDGAPDRTDEISIGDYTFLVDGRRHSEAPALLRKVQLSTINTNAFFARLTRRNQLWHQRADTKPCERRDEEASMELMLGDKGSDVLAELTDWVRQDLEEEIAALFGVFDVFYKVMREHYPNERVLHFAPKVGGPPLGLAGGASPPPNT